MPNKNPNTVTPEFRLSYPALFEPTAMNETQEKKYSLVMLIPKTTDITALRNLVKAAMEEKWPDPAKRPKPLKNPIRDGDIEKSDKEGYAGHWFIAARNKTKPGLVDENCQPVLSKEKLYAGCYCRASVTAFGYDNSGNRGISFSLQHVQFLRDGEPFSGRFSAEDDFGPTTAAKPAGVGAASEDWLS